MHRYEAPAGLAFGQIVMCCRLDRDALLPGNAPARASSQRLTGNLSTGGEMPDPGIVDQNVDGAECRKRPLHHRRDFIRFLQIGEIVAR